MQSYCSNCARHDIQTPTAFLTTHVKEPNENDWGKLHRVPKYMNGTCILFLTIMLDKIGVSKWSIDASYAIHNDCREHTEAMVTMEEEL